MALIGSIWTLCEYYHKYRVTNRYTNYQDINNKLLDILNKPLSSTVSFILGIAT